MRYLTDVLSQQSAYIARADLGTASVWYFSFGIPRMICLIAPLSGLLLGIASHQRSVEHPARRTFGALETHRPDELDVARAIGKTIKLSLPLKAVREKLRYAGF